MIQAFFNLHDSTCNLIYIINIYTEIIFHTFVFGPDKQHYFLNWVNNMYYDKNIESIK